MIDPIGGTWDEALVCDLFWEDDAKMILRILVHDGIEDIISWHYNKNSFGRNDRRQAGSSSAVANGDDRACCGNTSGT